MKSLIKYYVYCLFIFCVISIYPITKDLSLAVGTFVTSLGLMLALYSNKKTNDKANFDFLNSVLIDIEADLKSIDFSNAYVFNNSNLTGKFNEFTQLKPRLKELNGVNFIEVYYAYWGLINNNSNYQRDQENKLAPKEYDYMRYVEDLKYYLFMRLLYSNQEIIEVINKIDEFQLPNLSKKYLFRKIRRISFDYFLLLDGKGNVGGYASRKNPVTNYEMDIPYFKSKDSIKSQKFIHTSLFKESKFDELYKVLISKKVIEIGLSISEKHSEEYYK